MTKTYRKPSILLLVVLGLVFLVVGLLNLLDRIRWSDPDDGILWKEVEEGVVVDRTNDERAPAAIQSGDVLLRINRQDILNMEDYVNARFRLNPGEKAVYELTDSRTRKPKTLEVSIFGRSVLTLKDFFRMLLAIVYLCIGALVLLRYGQVQGGVHFYLVCLFSFSLYLFSYTKHLTILDFAVYWISVVSMLTLPPLFLHFCLNFPIRKPWMRYKTPVLSMIYGLSVLLFLLEVLWSSGLLSQVGLPAAFFLQGLPGRQEWTAALASFGLPRTPANLEFLDNLHILYFIAYFLLSIVILFHNRFKLRSPELRQQMKWIITGTMLAILPFCFLYVLPYLLNLEITSLMQSSMLSLALLPLAFAYAIMKYRLTDVDIIFKQVTAYFIASAAILGVYFLLIALSGMVFSHFFPNSHTVAIYFSALLAAFMFAPIRSRIQQEIDRVFYKEEYKHRRALIEFGRAMSVESNLKTVTDATMDRVCKSLRVDAVAIFLRTPPEEDVYEMAAHAGLPAQPDQTRTYTIPREFLLRDTDTLSLPYHDLDEHDGNWSQSLRAFYEGMSLYYFQPLVLRNEVMGIIALGRTRWESFLSSEDFELLRMLSGYAAIALENARLYSSVRNKASQLEAMKAYSDAVIEGINVGVVAIDPHEGITTWNSAMRGIFGLRREVVLGRRFEDVFPTDFAASVQKAMGAGSFFVNEPVNMYKLFMENSRGEQRFVNLTVTPFKHPTSPDPGVLMVFDDITAKVQLEKQMFQTEKLSSLGLIAAGVAHEVNTPLTGISSFTQFLIQEIPVDDPHHQILRKIEKQCDRASDIVSNLLNFSRMQTDEFMEIDINRILEETLTLIEHQFKRFATRVERDLERDLPPVRGSEGRLMQVFINILLNARDAVPEEGGRIIVRTRSDERTVTILIEDNGQGISSDIIHRIYDPFFTTKDTGKGTGLGLSVSHGIIQEHSGRIFVDSQPEQGTRFTIRLPHLRRNGAPLAEVPVSEAQGEG